VIFCGAPAHAARLRLNRVPSMVRRIAFLVLLVWTGCAAHALAQQVPGFRLAKQLRIEVTGDHYHLEGQVELEQGEQKFYADVVDYYHDTRRMVAEGNVVYAAPESRIAADRLEFDLATRTGTFYNASGSASLGEKADKSFFGTQEPDALFYGETIEKIGQRKYRITGGGFTSCVQPTPRWELVAGTTTVELERYALLTNTVLKVKGVPLFYLPAMYYPIQSDDRATGFLMPTYGSSIVRGQSVSNAFFWAINRSQDATVFHDWFTRRGQGTGAEYRYVAGQGSQGTFSTYFLNEKEASYGTGAGTITTPAQRNYEIRANAVQTLPLNLRARGNIDYFSSVQTRAVFNQNPFDWSSRTRSVRGNIGGAWGRHSVSASYDTTELFFSDNESNLQGGTPRLQYGFAQTQLGNTPVYVGIGGEAVRLARIDRWSADEVYDQGLTRLDVTPSIRVPFNRWPFLTFNSSVAWHNTYYSESFVRDENGRDVQAEVPLTRRYWDFRSDIVGPKLTRVWDTPNNGYAEKYKHTIEPTFTVQRLTFFEDYDRIPKLEGYDFTYGGTSRLSYGLVNRFTAKRRGGESTARNRDFLTVSVSQSYYSDPRASQFDFAQFPLNFFGRAPSNFSPIAMGAAFSPSEQSSISTRLDYDYDLREFQSIRLNGTYKLSEVLEVNGGWSQRKFSFFPDRPDKFFNASTTVRSRGNRFGGTYAFYYDLGRQTFLDQKIVGYYNAQCCGLVVEYQQFNFPQFSSFVVPQDRRFNIGFTLAGIGTFSNFLGAFGGNTGTAGGFGGGRGF
jgi:LPS-assembly protein